MRSARLVGTYYGYFYLVSALVAARAIPFAMLAAVGALGAAAIATMERRRLLDPR